ncbi:MAG: hypothetical protein ACI9JM_000422 [Halioglobus sp.]|jgi:hypothetical protein
MNNLNVNRSELKYYISNHEYAALVNRLKVVLEPDKHSVPGAGYFIRSLYFDSYDDKCLFEKQSGTMYRQKYRLRIYDTDSQIVKFEIKNKWNSQIFKESATISRGSAEKIIAGQYGELLTYNNPILNKVYVEFVRNHYKPKVVIDYDRDAFMSDFFNLRITIDKNLRSNNTDFDIFSSNMHTIPVVLEGKQILEIKYNECLPDYVRGILQPISFERSAISKYTLGRRFFKTHKWEDN